MPSAPAAGHPYPYAPGYGAVGSADQLSSSTSARVAEPRGTSR